MKIIKQELVKIIKEEVEKALTEMPRSNKLELDMIKLPNGYISTQKFKGRLLKVFKLTYNSPEDMERHKLFTKIASPWWPPESTNPRWEVDSLQTDADVKGMNQREMTNFQGTGLNMLAQKAPFKWIADKIANTRQYTKHFSSQVAKSYFVPEEIKNEKLRNSIVKQLTSAGFKPSKHSKYEVVFYAPLEFSQSIYSNKGLPTTVLTLGDFSKARISDVGANIEKAKEPGIDPEDAGRIASDGTKPTPMTSYGKELDKYKKRRN